MEYRVTADNLLATLAVWDGFIRSRGPIHLIACGGTALTLLGYKESTKDVDFMVPNEQEYKRLVRFLQRAGYEQITAYGWGRRGEVTLYDLYPGSAVYTTRLLDSPLKKGGHKKIRQWKRIYLGVLNPLDLVITKMFRGTQVDYDDCITLCRKEKISLKTLEARYKETAKYDVSEERVLRNYELLLQQIKRLNLKSRRKP